MDTFDDESDAFSPAEPKAKRARFDLPRAVDLSLFKSYLDSLPDPTVPFAKSLIRHLLICNIPANEIKISHIPTGFIKVVQLLNYPPPHASKGGAGELDTTASCITALHNFPRAHLKYHNEAAASDFGMAYKNSVLIADIYPFIMPTIMPTSKVTDGGEGKKKRTLANQLAEDKLGGKENLERMYHLLLEFLNSLVYEHNAALSSTSTSTSVSSSSSYSYSSSSSAPVFTYGGLPTRIFNWIMKKQLKDSNPLKHLSVGGLQPHPEAFITTYALQKNVKTGQDDGQYDGQDDRKGDGKGEGGEEDSGDGDVTTLPSDNEEKQPQKPTVLESSSSSTSVKPPLPVTVAKPSKPPKTTTALTSMPNAEDADKVLLKLVQTLGIEVRLEETKMFSELLKSRSKVLDELRESLSERASAGGSAAFEKHWGPVAVFLTGLLQPCSEVGVKRTSLPRIKFRFWSLHVFSMHVEDHARTAFILGFLLTHRLGEYDAGSKCVSHS
ncbi:hypothetical protein TrVE_jg484 [Triparma verrucosa]|uniref:Uncharacterized protein n=1 Tax=Triparma verrucosa TaxID=1606542 RepID=A0A9W7BMM3_9STRA|nr:hypothetical protein TrVE_jg484 [Triparma verrucosa]